MIFKQEWVFYIGREKLEESDRKRERERGRIKRGRQRNKEKKREQVFAYLVVCVCQRERERERGGDRQTVEKRIVVERASSSKVASLIVFHKTLLKTLPATNNLRTLDLPTKECNSVLLGRADLSTKKGMCRRHSARFISITLCPKFLDPKY